MEIKSSVEAACRTFSKLLATDRQTVVVGVIGFYEKVIKVKADVAAYLS